MILYEFEGKKLLMHAGVDIPASQLIASLDGEIIIKKPYVLKAQVLSGKRADAGGIVVVDDDKQGQKELTDLFGEVINKEKVERVLVEQKIDYEKAFYVSISYDTDKRAPVLSISEEGGTGIEERGVKSYEIDPLKPQSEVGQLPNGLITKLINLFFEQDCLLLEVNPLVYSSDGRWIALDAKIKLDDNAMGRHEDWDVFYDTPRSVPGHIPTEHEIEAKKIDEGDHRGTAGSSYFDLDGDIAVLSSGGGVSLTAMDALIEMGGKPANFTEYSGNPPKEKVVKLTKVVLNKPGIHGLWVIGTVAANFTDIYETLSGLIDGLREAELELDTKFNFPIVIRRGGPRDKEAFDMLSQVKDLNLHLQGPDTSITQSAEIMTGLATKYAHEGREQEAEHGG